MSLRIRTVFLSLVWLAVVAASVTIAVTRHEEYGHFAYIVPGMALFMATLFVLAFLPRRVSEGRIGERLGRLSVGALILCALVVLGAAIIQARGGLMATIVLGVFFLVFARIFVDWFRHMMKGPSSRSAGRSKRRATPPDAP